MEAPPGSSGLGFLQTPQPAGGVREGGRGRSGALRRARALAALPSLLRCPRPSPLGRAEETRRRWRPSGSVSGRDQLSCALSVPLPRCPGPREAAAVVAGKGAAVSRPRLLGCGAGDFANASRDILYSSYRAIGPRCVWDVFKSNGTAVLCCPITFM